MNEPPYIYDTSSLLFFSFSQLSLYLSECCIIVSGRNASGWIEHYTTQEIARLLSDKHNSLADIANQLNFSSVSYLSRYCTKHLGQSPSEYRQSLQPK